MDDNTTPIEKLFERAEDYSRTSIELFRLNAIDKSAEIISSIATKSAILLVVVSFVLFLNIGLALMDRRNAWKILLWLFCCSRFLPVDCYSELSLPGYMDPVPGKQRYYLANDEKKEA
jgi:hypothetical protein